MPIATWEPREPTDGKSKILPTLSANQYNWNDFGCIEPFNWDQSRDRREDRDYRVIGVENYCNIIWLVGIVLSFNPIIYKYVTFSERKKSAGIVCLTLPLIKKTGQHFSISSSTDSYSKVEYLVDATDTLATKEIVSWLVLSIRW